VDLVAFRDEQSCEKSHVRLLIVNNQDARR
jgi:hypothetical protein